MCIIFLTIKMLYSNKSEKRYSSYFGDSAPVLKIIYRDGINFPLVSMIDFNSWYNSSEGVGILRDYEEYLDFECIRYADKVIAVKPSVDIEVKTLVLDIKYKQLFDTAKVFKCVPVSTTIESFNYINIYLYSKTKIVINKDVISDELIIYLLNLCFTKKYNNIKYSVLTSYGDIDISIINVNKTGFIYNHTKIHFTESKTITYIYKYDTTIIPEKELDLKLVELIQIKELEFEEKPLIIDFSQLKIGGLRNQLIEISNVIRPRGISQKHLDQIGMDEFERGIILHGPPGTGKTTIARELSNMLGVSNFIVVNGPELINKYIGESEANIRRVLHNDSKNLKVVFFDEFDCIGKERGGDGNGSQVANNIVNQILSIMDGVDRKNNILIIAATNRLDIIDSALLRPGRFGLCLYIGLPKKSDRIEIFNIHLSKNISNLSLDNVSIEWLAEQSENYSGAEIKGICKKAREIALAEAAPDMTNLHNIDINLLKLNHRHFEQSFHTLKSNISGNGAKLNELLPNGDGNKDAIEYILDICSHINNSSRINTILLNGNKWCYKSSSCRIICEQLKSFYDTIIIITNNMVRELSKIELNTNNNILIILDGFEHLCGILNVNSYNHKNIDFFNQFVNKKVTGKIILITTMRTTACSLFKSINPSFEWNTTYTIE